MINMYLKNNFLRIVFENEIERINIKGQWENFCRFLEKHVYAREIYREDKIFFYLHYINSDLILHYFIAEDLYYTNH